MYYKCGNCGKTFARESTKCPHCGVYFSRTIQTTVSRPSPYAEEARGIYIQLAMLFAGMVIVGAFLYLLVYAGIITDTSSKNENAAVSVTETPTATPEPTEMAYHTLPIDFALGVFFDYSLEGHPLASVHSRDSIEIFDVADGRKLYADTPRGISRVAFNAPFVAIFTQDELKLRNFEEQVQITLPQSEGNYRTLFFSPDGKILVAVDETKKITRFWQTDTGELLQEYPEELLNLTFAPDSQAMAFNRSDGIIEIRSVDDNALLHTFESHAEQINALVFQPNGTMLAVVDGGTNKAVYLWDISGEKQQYALNVPGITGVFFSPDGETLAITYMKSPIRLYRAEDGNLLYTLEAHDKIVKNLDFSPDSTIFVTSSSDNTIKLWRTQTGEQLQVLTGHKAGVIDAIFSPDGESIVSFGAGMIILWDIREYINQPVEQ